MKRLRISIVALLVIAAGVMPATAISFYFDTLAKDYPLDAQWTTSAGLVSVYDLPTVWTRDPLRSELGAGALASDMAGKISGVEYVSLYFGAPENLTNNYATFAVDVTGSISTKGTDPVVKMTLKGTGYSVDSNGNNGPRASLKLTFTSTRPLAYFYEELALGNVTRTNDYADLEGTLRATVKVGKSFNYKISSETARLSDAIAGGEVGKVWAIHGTNFFTVWHGSGLDIYGIPLQGQVIQPDMKNAKFSIVAGAFSGKGAVNDKKGSYKATITSVADLRGAKLTLSGFTGDLIAGYTSTNDAGIYDLVKYPTGYITNIVTGAIKTLNLSGKAGGQKVSQEGVNLDAPF